MYNSHKHMNIAAKCNFQTFLTSLFLTFHSCVKYWSLFYNESSMWVIRKPKLVFAENNYPLRELNVSPRITGTYFTQYRESRWFSRRGSKKTPPNAIQGHAS